VGVGWRVERGGGGVGCSWVFVKRDIFLHVLSRNGYGGTNSSELLIGHSKNQDQDQCVKIQNPKMLHNSRMLLVTLADMLQSKSYGPAQGFGAQTKPPGGPQRLENKKHMT
jgi:hypothetical protein